MDKNETAKLSLDIETLCHLTEAEARAVNGGKGGPVPCTAIVSFGRPSANCCTGIVSLPKPGPLPTPPVGGPAVC